MDGESTRQIEQQMDEGPVIQEPVAGPSIARDVINMESNDVQEERFSVDFTTARGSRIQVTDEASKIAELLFKDVVEDKDIAKWFEEAKRNEGVSKKEQLKIDEIQKEEVKKEEVKMDEAELNEYIFDYMSDGEWDDVMEIA